MNEFEKYIKENSNASENDIIWKWQQLHYQDQNTESKRVLFDVLFDAFNTLYAENVLMQDTIKHLQSSRNLVWYRFVLDFANNIKNGLIEIYGTESPLGDITAEDICDEIDKQVDKFKKKLSE